MIVDHGTLTDAERADLLARREAVWRAWFAHDRNALLELLPPEAVAGDPGPDPWANRDEILRRSAAFVASGAKLVSLDFPTTTFQRYGEVVILYVTYRFEIDVGGERSVFAGRGTEVFVRADGAWRNTSWHLDTGM